MCAFEIELRNYCYMVQRGKPAASIALQDRHITEATKLVTKDFGLYTYVEELYEGWKTFWVYKYEHILDVIKSMPQEPKTQYDHWVLGKLYGYDEAAIDEFILSRRA